MEAAAASSLPLVDAFHLSSARAAFVSQDVVALHTGNAVTLLNTGSGGRSVLVLPAGYSLDCVAVCASHQLVACAVHGIATEIRLYTYPSLDLVSTLAAPAESRFVAVDVSRDGRRLAAVADEVEPKVVCWDVESGARLAEMVLKDAATWLGFSPTSHLVLAVASPRGVLVLRSESRFEPALTVINVGLHGDGKMAREVRCAAWTPAQRLCIGTSLGEVLEVALDSKHLAGRSGSQASIAAVATDAAAVPIPSAPRSLAPRTLFSDRHAVTALATSRKHVVAGTEDGEVIWVDEAKGRRVRAYRLAPSEDVQPPAQRAVLHLGFEPGFRALLAVDRLGSLWSSAVTPAWLLEGAGSARPPTSLVLQMLLVPADQSWGAVRVSALRFGAEDGQSVAVTCSERGELVVWRFGFGSNNKPQRSFLGYYAVADKGRLTCLAASPVGGQLVACGFDSGHVVVLSLTGLGRDDARLRCVFAQRIHAAPVAALEFSESGGLVASACRAGTLCWLELDAAARQGTLIRARGFARLPAAATALAWASQRAEAPELMVAMTNNVLARVRVPSEWPAAAAFGEVSLKLEPQLKLPSEASSLSVSPNTDFVAVALSDRRVLLVLSGRAELTVVRHEVAHLKPATVVAFSPDGQLVATGGADGVVRLFAADYLRPVAEAAGHAAALGGVAALSFSPDSLFLLSSGRDGALSLWNVADYTGGPKPFTAPRVPQQALPAHVLEADGEAADAPQAEAPSPPPALARATSLCPPALGASGSGGVGGVAGGAVGGLVGADGAAAADSSHTLQSEVESFRARFEALLRANEEAPELERMGREEFAIDLEMLASLEKQAREEADRARATIEQENLAKELVIHRIKTECWDSMEVQAKSFRGMASTAQVHNFPIRRVPPAEQRRLQQAVLLRQMELREEAFNNSIAAGGDEERRTSVEALCANARHYLVSFERDDDSHHDGDTKRPAGASLGAKAAVSGVASASASPTAATGAGAAAAAAAAGGGGGGGGGAVAPASSPSAAGAASSVKGAGAGGPPPTPVASAGSGSNPSAGAAGSGGSGIGAGVGASAAGASGSIASSGTGGGGRGATALSAASLLYHPLTCTTRLRKKTQAILLVQRCRELKRTFNEEFQRFEEFKQRETEKLAEKAARIREIYAELKIDRPVFVPSPGAGETPEAVLTVTDDEINVPKFAPATASGANGANGNEDGAMRAQRQAAEDARAAAQRALDEMMGGTLETKRDMSLLEQELQREEWMDKVPREQMTDEQRTQLAAFEKKVEALRAERETRRKLLETEATKLQNDSAEIVRSFDSKLVALHERRVAVQRRVCEQELMVIKLLNGVLEEDAKDTRERELRRRIVEVQAAQTDAAHRLEEFRPRMEAAVRRLEQLQGEERAADKRFRSEFREAGERLEPLYKIFRFRKQAHEVDLRSFGFRRRSSIAMDTAAAAAASSGSGATGAASGAGLVGVTPGSQSRRISTLAVGGVQTAAASGSAAAGGAGVGADASLVQSQASLGVSERRSSMLRGAAAAAAAPLADALDPFSEEGAAGDVASFSAADRPEEIPQEMWGRVLVRRQQQIAKEAEVREAQTQLHDHQQHLSHLESVDAALQSELKQLRGELAGFQEMRRAASANVELFLRVLQGQVELNEAPVVTDMRDAVFVDRASVEALNSMVLKLGKEKLAVIDDITEARKGIRRLQWLQKKFVLDHQDAADLTTELQLLRVTKNLQALIKMGGRDLQTAAELQKAERNVEFLRAATNEKIKVLRGKLTHMVKKERALEAENERLRGAIVQLEHAVRERQEIRNIRRQPRDSEDSERMRQVVARRKLVDLARLQSEEIKLWRTQVERLRRRTYPAFQAPVGALFGDASRPKPKSGPDTRELPAAH